MVPQSANCAKDTEIAAVIAERPDVAAAWVFGSAARGELRADSDLDVALLLRRRPSRAETLDLYGLAAALERFSPSGRVDILILGEQGPVLRHRILREGRLVWDADPALRFDFEARTFSEYLDWKPTHDIAMQVALEGLRRRLARGAK